jgi:hypothetical protein
LAAYENDRRIPIAMIGVNIGSIALISFIFLWTIYPFAIAQDRHDFMKKFVKTKETTENMSPTNEQHIPVVPREYARYKMEKILGKVKNYSYYDLEEPYIQKINNRLYWIAALNHKSFFKWLNTDGVPGYMKMSAEDHQSEAQFVAHSIKYVPSGYFSENLIRLARTKYPDLIFMQPSFEPDENGKPYYALSYGSYHKMRNIRSVEGVILIDPANGQMKKYPMKQVPSFVDQVVPHDIAYDYNYWFGKYKHGFWNSILGKTDVHVPPEEFVAVFDHRLHMYWATDHTRDEENAGSMVGYSMLNSRTGELNYYSKTNGMINGTTAMNVVEKTFREKQWHGASPILYYIYGQYTWIVPALDSNNVIRKIVLVNAKDEKVIGHGDSKQEAFDQYQYAISTNFNGDSATPTPNAKLAQTKGKVTAVYKNQQADETYVQFLIEGNNHIFTMSSKNNPYIIFLETGHEVDLRYIETKQTIVATKQVKNLTLKK